MKKLILCFPLLITGCMVQKPLPTIDQYCGQSLGLKYGTNEYARCGLEYSQMVNAYQQNAQAQRSAAWGRIQRSLAQNAQNQAVIAAQSQPVIYYPDNHKNVDVYVHPGY